MHSHDCQNQGERGDARRDPQGLRYDWKRLDMAGSRWNLLRRSVWFRGFRVRQKIDICRLANHQHRA
jgi:hypothetical protein